MLDLHAGPPPFAHRPGKDLGHGTAVFLAQIQGLLAIEFASANCCMNRVTKGLGITRLRRRFTDRSNMNVTTRNEQRTMAYINGPPSLRIRLRLWVGIDAVSGAADDSV